MGLFARRLSQYWDVIQGSLFSFLEEELDPLTKKQQQLVTILEFVRIEQFVPDYFGCEGRPTKDRKAIARSFIAKLVYNMDTTKYLLERLKADKNLRRICGWETPKSIPSESTFSRAFAAFARIQLPHRVHEALIKTNFSQEVILHNSRDSTAIIAREKPQKKPKKEYVKKNRTAKKKNSELTRIEKQKSMLLEEMLQELPKKCSKGAKKDSKGNSMYWNGYKLHLDVIDGGIPVSAVVTSASVHDSQVAIPLATMTKDRITNLYDLIDAAYDIPAIREHSTSLGHVALIDKNPRRNVKLKQAIKAEAKARKTLKLKFPEDMRYNVRSTAERANARIKDEFGAEKVRVKGHMKVACHLLFGVLVLAADQLMKIVT